MLPGESDSPAVGRSAALCWAAGGACGGCPGTWSLGGRPKRQPPFRDMQPNASPPAGVHYVFDATIAADFSILESQKEFVRRFHQHSEEEPALPMLTSACPGERRVAAGPRGLRRSLTWAAVGAGPGQRARSGVPGPLGGASCQATCLLILGGLLGRPSR